MSKVNTIQNAILQLEGGAFQSLVDEYLYKKYHFDNIQTLGVQTGTHKPTKGIPDSYVVTKDNKYILINYGSVKEKPAEKIKNDIMSCFDKGKLILDKGKILQIICVYTSTNIHLEQFDDIKEMIEDVEVKLIGIDTISYDLSIYYPNIAYDHLGIMIDTHQIFDIDDFIKVYDVNGMNSPINTRFFFREDELGQVLNSVRQNKVTVVTGPSGIGKTRLVLEVCRTLVAEGWKNFCIKNNGQLLYEDLQSYIGDIGKYLLFFDDANNFGSFENVLNYLCDLSAEFEIKIILTIRDYAKSRVINSVGQFFGLEEIVLSELKDDEIKGIVKENLNIINDVCLQRIAEVAKGNIRLAMLAGMKSVDDGSMAIRNAEDIFKIYYGTIMERIGLGKSDLLLIFLVSFLGPIRFKQNDFYRQLIKQFEIEDSEENIIEKLYLLELLDWFKGEIVKIADQCFGNYVLYYVVFVKRWITIENIIQLGFPKFKNKIIYALNTLVELFASQELIKYVEKGVNKAWDSAGGDEVIDYVEVFYKLNQEKALIYLKKYVDDMVEVSYDLHTFDFEAKKNYSNIENREIKILSGYKNTNYFAEAIDLLLMLYTKRPDFIMDVYFAITEGIMFDKDLYDCKYKHEHIIINKLWNAAKQGEDYNNSILFMYVVFYALRCEFRFAEAGNRSSEVAFIKMTIVVCDEIKNLRNFIYKSLGVLYQREEYKKQVITILNEIHVNGLDEKSTIELIESDFNSIYSFLGAKDKLNFEETKIIAHYGKVAKQIGITLEECDKRVEDNYDYKVYGVLAHKDFIGETEEEDEYARKKDIALLISGYTIKDFRYMFLTLSNLESKCLNDIWALGTGLGTLFELLKPSKDFFKEVFMEYMKAGVPFGRYVRNVVPYMIDQYGGKITLAEIQKNLFSDQNWWLNRVWEDLPEDEITAEMAASYKRYLIKNFESDCPIIPSVYFFEKYVKYEPELPIVIAGKVLSNNENIRQFLGCAFREKQISALDKLFTDKLETLINLYFGGIDKHFDYDRSLFWYIYKKDDSVWERYLFWLKGNLTYDGYGQKLFERIWNEDDYGKRIEFAIEVLVENEFCIISENTVSIIFANSLKTSELSEERKHQWIVDYIKRYYDNIDKIKMIVGIVATVFPAWKCEMILIFLDINKSIEVFKELYLFPLSESWSGSEIPLIDKKIKFLEELHASLKGIDYIEHKKYLKECIASEESYKERVEIREYLENVDYA